MKLPENQIGISDILTWRDCPAKFAYQMQRHEAPIPGEDQSSNAYGSAVHEAIALAEGGASNDDAVASVWPRFAAHLDPEDLALLKEDLDRFRRHAPIGMELVAAEAERRVPLFIHEGVQFYFRFKLDALYRSLTERGVFYMVDYKSSKWRKSQAEVDSDLQQWAYNWAVHELYPECVSLLQCYDQLRFGRLLTSKNDAQRAQMREWLTVTVKSILRDETLEAKQNQFCPWCPLVVTCPETRRASDVWKARLALLAPKTVEGRRVKIEFGTQEDELESMMRDVLPHMQETRKHMQAVEAKLKTLIEQLPSETRQTLGWRLKDRKTKFLSPEGLAALHEALGPTFYEIAGVSKSALESAVGKGSPEAELARSLELERVDTTMLVHE